MKYRPFHLYGSLLFALLLFNVAPAFADCTSPAGPEGYIVYNTTYKMMQFCNGTDWIAVAGFGGGGSSGPLSGLTDVDVTGVADGNCLVYNNAAGKWEDGACGSGGGDDLGNHTATQDLDLATHGLMGTGGIGFVGLAGNQPQSRGADNLGDHTATQDLDMASNKITNLATPTNGTDAATKAYVDSAGGGGLPTCSEGDGLVFTSGAWACLQDTTPDSFGFTDQSNVAKSTLTTSNTINITGISGSASVSVSGQGSPQVSINGGAWGTSGTITSGQSLQVRLTSASTITTAYTATVAVGTGTGTPWVVTTTNCTGAFLGGYCWFARGLTNSCDTACAAVSGTCNLAGTKDYAGSGGTNTNCDAVLSALGFGNAGVSALVNADGCQYISSTRYRGSLATTCAASGASVNRACACDL